MVRDDDDATPRCEDFGDTGQDLAEFLEFLVGAGERLGLPGEPLALTAALVRAQGYRLFALTLRYGQRHAREIEAARAVAATLGVVRHVELDVDLSAFGGSSLTTTDPVPKDRTIIPDEIPSTYVPGRNTVFIAIGLSLAEARGAERLVLGVNAVDCN